MIPTLLNIVDVVDSVGGFRYLQCQLGMIPN